MSSSPPASRPRRFPAPARAVPRRRRCGGPGAPAAPRGQPGRCRRRGARSGPRAAPEAVLEQPGQGPGDADPLVVEIAGEVEGAAQTLPELVRRILVARVLRPGGGVAVLEVVVLGEAPE